MRRKTILMLITAALLLPLCLKARELPDTGQATNYEQEDDSTYAGAQPSFTNNGDGTVTDNNTELMWVEDGNSAGCNDGNPLSWIAALNFCNNLNYAGYDDWRLPDRRELMSIVNYGNSNPAVDTSVFPNTQSSYYWTSTTYKPDDSLAWLVNFLNGGVGSRSKGDGSYVRPVRGGPQ